MRSSLRLCGNNLQRINRPRWALDHRRAPPDGIIQPSALHASGYSLRFPRIVRLRPDKLAADADTFDRVGQIYAEMLAREAVAP